MDTYPLAPMQPWKSSSNSPVSVKDTSFTSAPVGDKVAISENDQHWSSAGRDIPRLVSERVFESSRSRNKQGQLDQSVDVDEISKCNVLRATICLWSKMLDWSQEALYSKEWGFVDTRNMERREEGRGEKLSTVWKLRHFVNFACYSLPVNGITNTLTHLPLSKESRSTGL